MVTTTKPRRNSAIELLRIVAMLIILANHFSVHGLFHGIDRAVPEIVLNNIYSYQILFTKFVDWGGTLGNYIFILITGYFMINRQVKYKKIIILLATMFFYSWIILIFVYIFMPQLCSVKLMFNSLIPIFVGENWFVSCYIIFFAFVPFINKFLGMIDQKFYEKFLIVAFVFYIFLPFLRMQTFMKEAPILFFVLVYAIGGYLRLYFMKKINLTYHKQYIRNTVLILTMILSSILMLEITAIFVHKNILVTKATYISHLFDIPLAIMIFLSFAAMKPFFNKYVNIVAGTVLGVYLLHENMFLRRIIWDYIFPNVDYITSNWYILFYAIKVVAIFVICSGIDLLRKRYIEPPMARFIDRYFDTVSEYAKIKANNVIALLNK